MALPILHPTPADYAIAADALSHARPIIDVAADMDLPTDPEEFFAFGRLIAKIDQTQAARHLRKRTDAELVLVTAMTPTPKGSGKTLTTIALTDALNLLLGRKGTPKQKATAVLRQPSMGPVFGNKGGAAGGGYSQCIPMQDINLHFTGDLHAITAAHNLLFAMAMAFAYEGNNKHGVDLKRFSWPRAVDMVDRSLRELSLSASGRLKDDALRINSRYVITAASEIMATVGISRNMDDLRFRLARIQLGCLKDGRPLLARDIDAVNPMLAMLLHAFNPNLVQTLGGNGIFVHCGPFANIAHGNASLAAMQLGGEGLRLCPHRRRVRRRAGGTEVLRHRLPRRRPAPQRGADRLLHARPETPGPVRNPWAPARRRSARCALARVSKAAWPACGTCGCTSRTCAAMACR